MKIKLDKTTISLIIRLLGELISLLRKVSKENEGNDMDRDFKFLAENLTRFKHSMLAYKFLLERERQYEKDIQEG